MDFTRGTFGPDDCVNDIVELKFDKPVPIKENMKYAIRLRNRGGRTSNGDVGLSVVKGPDGTTFTFTACSLSFNGIVPCEQNIISFNRECVIRVMNFCRYNTDQRTNTSYPLLLESSRLGRSTNEQSNG